MKRLFLVLVLMLGLAACVEESLDETTRNSIGFEPMVGKNTIIKATELNDDNFSEFRVWAYYTDDDNFGTLNANPSTYIPGIEVTKSGSHWNYSPAYYWPLTGNLSFFGIGGDDGENLAISLEENSPYPSFSYTVTNNSSQQKDLVVAVITNQNKQANGGNAVNMVFNHILTQVNFSLKGANPNLKYIIHKIEIQDAFYIGNFTFNSSIIDETNGSTWEPDITTKVTYTYYPHAENEPGLSIPAVVDGEEHSFIPFGSGTTGEALMLMPQDFVGTIKVKYDVINPAGQTLHTNKIAERDLTATWEIGSKIRYNLTLPVGGSLIEFDVENEGVADWGIEQTE